MAVGVDVDAGSNVDTDIAVDEDTGMSEGMGDGVAGDDDDAAMHLDKVTDMRVDMDVDVLWRW